MKKSLFAILVFSLISMFTLPVRPAPQELAGTVTLSGAWALYPMAVKWAEEFSKIHPKVRVEVQASTAVMQGDVRVGLVVLDAVGGVSRWLPGDPAAMLRSRHLLQPISNAQAAAELGLSPRPLIDTLRDALAWFRAQGLCKVVG